MSERTYIAIDLKSFYASVECVERGLDPLTANLVVADKSRTDKTICLAVSPALKAYGIPGRARLFEVVQKAKEINELRRQKAPGGVLKGSSVHAEELAEDPSLALDYVVAVPHMAHYMEVSTHIYEMYLKYIAPEDIHVYSIDEVFIDATSYLKMYKRTPHELTMMLVRDVLTTTGITATAGIGPNMFLCKIAMDIEAKHSPADKDGVRIAELTEETYRQKYWDYRPLTDFWRVGGGIARRLERVGLFTMGDIARCSVQNEDLLYNLFGVNAELLIDHAWGVEPCTMEAIKQYKPEGSSVSSGQVLMRPYPFHQAKNIAREMAEQMTYDLMRKHLVTDQLVLSVGYDNGNLEDPKVLANYKGEVVQDYYGRLSPKPAHGSVNLHGWTDSLTRILEAIEGLFDRIVDPLLTVRRMYVVAARVMDSEEAEKNAPGEQLDLFANEEEEAETKKLTEKDKKRQQAILSIRERFGSNAVFMGMDLEEGAMTMERNKQVGGHRA